MFFSDFFNSLYVLFFIYLKSRQLSTTYKAEDQISENLNQVDFPLMHQMFPHSKAEAEDWAISVATNISVTFFF